MGSTFSIKNNCIQFLHPFTLLFKEPNINIEYGKTKQSHTFSLLIYIFIFIYSIATVIYIMLSDKTSVEVCLSTFCLSVTFIGLIIYGTVVKQCKWIVIQNVRNVELFLLCIVYVIFSLLNKIICWHIKKKLETQKNQTFFEFLFIDIEIVSKLIWALSADNEFIFLFCSNILFHFHQ